MTIDQINFEDFLRVLKKIEKLNSVYHPSNNDILHILYRNTSVNSSKEFSISFYYEYWFIYYIEPGDKNDLSIKFYRNDDKIQLEMIKNGSRSKFDLLLDCSFEDFLNDANQGLEYLVLAHGRSVIDMIKIIMGVEEKINEVLDKNDIREILGIFN